MMFESGWYMSSLMSKIDDKYIDTIGVILTMNQWGINADYLERGCKWCFDNGVFTNKFILDEWLDKLIRLEKYKDTCLFVTVPDVVGDAKATIDQFHHYRSMVNTYPVAFVSQDRISKYVDYIPWNNFDVLFVGGSNRHKLGKEGGWIISEAKKHNKWVHVGRVNSTSRIRKFWNADSWDGTHLSFQPNDISKIHHAVTEVRLMKSMKGLFV